MTEYTVELARRLMGVASSRPEISVTLTAVASEEEDAPSVTFRRNASMAGPSGAVNVGVGEVWFDNITVGPSSWLHRYDIASASGSYDAVPFRVAVWPGRTVWSGPASATGGLLTGMMGWRAACMGLLATSRRASSDTTRVAGSPTAC